MYDSYLLSTMQIITTATHARLRPQLTPITIPTIIDCKK